MPRRDASGEDHPLEVIDLEPELGPRPDPGTRNPRRRTSVVVIGIAVLVVVGATVFASRRDHASKQPTGRSESVGRFYPPLDRGDVRLVLPSGVTVVLAGDVQRTLNGLGATFAGGIGSVEFRIARADPSKLFDSLASDPIPSAIGVAGSDASAPSLVNLGRRLGVASSGDWTLVAFLSDSEGVAHAQLDEVADWQLRPTPNGAVVVAPTGAIGESSVVFESATTGTRRVELSADNCAGTSLRTQSRIGDLALGRWCADGVYVGVSGPEAFVTHALATLRVTVQRASP